MKKLSLIILALAAVSVGCGGTDAQTETAGEPVATTGSGATGVVKKAAAAVGIPTYREITIPAGTTLALELGTAVASDTSQVEDSVRASLRRAVTIGSTQVLPAGTEVMGNVTQVQRSGRVKGRAQVAFRFTSLSHSGDDYDISTESISRMAEATKGQDAAKIGIGAGAGAAVGAILGGGDGAAKGAAIGGAGGTGVVLATRGKEVRLGPGLDVSTNLTAPVKIRVKVS